MWRRSWLSREVLLFGAFSGAATLYAGVLWFELPGGPLAGAVTVLLGLSGVSATACIYRVGSRPAWNSWLTLLRFLATAGVLGPLFAAAIGAGDPRGLTVAIVTFTGLNALLIAVAFLRLIGSDVIELRGTARLLSTTLAVPFMLRGGLLLAGGVVLPLAYPGQPAFIAGLALALAGEIVGRWLFFVSVVPKLMTTPYLAMGSEAA
jgi:DMSO reductase anchor subunit